MKKIKKIYTLYARYSDYHKNNIPFLNMIYNIYDSDVICEESGDRYYILHEWIGKSNWDTLYNDYYENNIFPKNIYV